VGSQRKCRDCGDLFTPARADAVFCAARCRQSAYRARTKLKGEHSDHGWPLKPSQYGYPGREHCTWLLEDGVCRNMATWLIWTQSNRGATPQPWLGAYWCEEHLPASLAPYEVVAVSPSYTSAVYR
jgi:hypothetical protein